MENSASGNVSAGEGKLLTRRVNARPAYKGRATYYGLAAFVFFTAWVFTAAWLVYTLRHTEIIKVIPPTAYEGARE